MHNETEITFVEDIAKQVAEEFGIEYNEALAIYEYGVKYLKHLTLQEENNCVSIPYLGTIHTNKHLLKKSMRAQETKKKQGFNIDEEKYEMSKNRLANIMEFHEERRKHSYDRTMHVKMPILWKIRQKTKITLPEIEQIQQKENGKSN